MKKWERGSILYSDAGEVAEVTEQPVSSKLYRWCSLSRSFLSKDSTNCGLKGIEKVYLHLTYANVLPSSKQYNQDNLRRNYCVSGAY